MFHRHSHAEENWTIFRERTMIIITIWTLPHTVYTFKRTTSALLAFVSTSTLATHNRLILIWARSGKMVWVTAVITLRYKELIVNFTSTQVQVNPSSFSLNYIVSYFGLTSQHKVFNITRVGASQNLQSFPR